VEGLCITCVRSAERRSERRTRSEIRTGLDIVAKVRSAQVRLLFSSDGGKKWYIGRERGGGRRPKKVKAGGQPSLLGHLFCTLSVLVIFRVEGSSTTNSLNKG